MSLVQTQCPYCKSPLYAYQPACFACRNAIQWPAPATAEQQAMQASAVQWFNAAVAAYQAQQQQAGGQAPAAAPAATAPATAAPPRRQVQVDTSLQGMLEVTHHAPAAYDVQQAEEIEGLLPSSLKEFVPANVATEAVEGLQVNKAEAAGPGLGITGFEGLEATHVQGVGDVAVSRTEGFERTGYDEVTAAAPAEVGSDPLVEATAIDVPDRPDPAVAAAPARKKKAVTGASMVCGDCGTRTENSRCPSCGARTRIFVSP